jgi:hypothetical protein
MWLLLLACTKGDGTLPVDTGPDVVRESSPWSDSQDDTGDPSTDVELRVSPSSAVIGVGGVLELRVVVLDSRGEARDVQADLAVDQASVLGLSGASVEGASAGTATVTATFDGLTTSSEITVQAEDLLTLRLVDGRTGAALDDTRVAVDGVRYLAESGALSVPLSDGQPLTFTAYHVSTDYIPATVYGAVVRDITLPLRLATDEDPPSSVLGGSLDFSACEEAEWDELLVGFSGASVQSHPLLMDADDLVGESRVVDFYGADVNVPGNISLGGLDETWSSLAEPGAVGAWSFAGPVPIAELSAGITTVTQAVGLLQDRSESIRHTWVGGLEAGEADLSQDLAPSGELSESLTVTLPELPAGFAGTEEILLVALAEGPEGHAVMGLGAGLGTAELHHAPLEGGQVLAYVEVGGVGTGGGRSLQMLPLEGAAVVFGDFLQAPALSSFDGSSGGFELSNDAQAQLVRVHVLSFDGGKRDLWLGGGSVAEELTRDGPSMGFGRTIWRVTALDLDEGSLQGRLSSGELGPAALESGVRRSALLEEQRTGG